MSGVASTPPNPKRSKQVKVAALAFTIAILAIGYDAFGFWTTMIFTSGFLGGYLLWLAFPAEPDFQKIKAPYWTVIVLFLGHRIEEKVSGFFARLSVITGVETPEVTSAPVIAIVLCSVGAWLIAPALVKRKLSFGYYLMWTLFAAMGITELAHIFVFPFFSEPVLQYFPGMISVVFLAPAAWWGMRTLAKDKSLIYSVKNVL